MVRDDTVKQASSEFRNRKKKTGYTITAAFAPDGTCRGPVSLRLPEPGDGTPGCPNVPTTTVAPPTFSPRCAWAQTGYEQSGGNAAGSYFLQLAECAIDGSSLATTRYIANRAGATNYQVPTDFEEVCLMFYEKRSGSANCRTVCEQLGSTCNRVLAAIGADGTDKCETDNNNNGGNCGYDDENADDVQTFNDQICACNIPPEPGQAWSCCVQRRRYCRVRVSKKVLLSVHQAP